MLRVKMPMLPLKLMIVQLEFLRIRVLTLIQHLKLIIGHIILNYQMKI